MREPSEQLLALLVEDGEAVVVGGAEARDGVLECLVGLESRAFVDEHACVLVTRSVGERLFDGARGHDAEE